MYKVLSIIIIICFRVVCLSQGQNELFNKLNQSKSDTQKISILNSLTTIYIDKNLDSAEVLNNKALSLNSLNLNEKELFQLYYNKALIEKKLHNENAALFIAKKTFYLSLKNNHKSEQVKSLLLIGNIHDQKNENNEALLNFNKALSIAKSTQNKNDLMLCYKYLGIYYKKINNKTEALNYLLQAAKIAEEISDLNSIFTIYINLGSLYEKTGDAHKALVFLRKANSINNVTKNLNDKAIVYFKIGRLFQGLKNIDSAKYYFTETLNIHLKNNDEKGLIFDYTNIASLYVVNNDINAAENEYLKALDLSFKYKDSIKINIVYAYLGKFYKDNKEYLKSLKNYNLSLQYVNSLLSKEAIAEIYKEIAILNYELKNYKLAYDNYVIYKNYTDLIYNANDTKRQTELKLNYEFEKTQKRIEKETLAKEIISANEIEKQKLQRNYLLVGLILISLLLIIAIKNYKAKQKVVVILQKQKKEIEFQKSLVEEKNTEISDSINYALKIQSATIPRAEEINECLTNYDLFFKPKDVVSGDFYWCAKNNDLSLIAIADCTGHGVPGAITSMIGHMLLNEIFYVKKIYEPEKVLKELNRLVKLTLRQEENTLTNDGMDIAFCLLNNVTNELFYAGANRPLYLLKSSNEFIEYKASKYSVGGQNSTNQNYELNKIQLTKGDTIILSTDGYADQFGGPNDKKFTTKKFKEILKSTDNNLPKEIKEKLELEHEQWKQKTVQTDDILVFIFKI